MARIVVILWLVLTADLSHAAANPYDACNKYTNQQWRDCVARIRGVVSPQPPSSSYPVVTPPASPRVIGPSPNYAPVVNVPPPRPAMVAPIIVPQRQPQQPAIQYNNSTVNPYDACSKYTNQQWQDCVARIRGVVSPQPPSSSYPVVTPPASPRTIAPSPNYSSATNLPPIGTVPAIVPQRQPQQPAIQAGKANNIYRNSAANPYDACNKYTNQQWRDCVAQIRGAVTQQPPSSSYPVVTPPASPRTIAPSPNNTPVANPAVPKIVWRKPIPVQSATISSVVKATPSARPLTYGDVLTPQEIQWMNSLPSDDATRNLPPATIDRMKREGKWAGYVAGTNNTNNSINNDLQDKERIESRVITGLKVAKTAGNVAQGALIFTPVGKVTGAVEKVAVKGIEEGAIETSAEVDAAGTGGINKAGAVIKKTSNQLGKEGEDAVRAVYNIGEKNPIYINGRARIPDGLNTVNKTISEVKNVKSLSLTEQLRDDIAYAQREGFRFDLYVRPDTELSGPLIDAIKSNLIRLSYIP